MEIEILTVLETAHPRMLKRSTVQAEVSLAVDGFTLTEFDRVLLVLERKGQIRIIKGEDITRLAITAAGLNRLAETR